MLTCTVILIFSQISCDILCICICVFIQVISIRYCWNSRESYMLINYVTVCIFENVNIEQWYAAYLYTIIRCMLMNSKYQFVQFIKFHTQIYFKNNFVAYLPATKILRQSSSWWAVSHYIIHLQRIDCRGIDVLYVQTHCTSTFCLYVTQKYTSKSGSPCILHVNSFNGCECDHLNHRSLICLFVWRF